MRREIQPKILRILPGGVPLRELYRSEDIFFRNNGCVAGMATEDGAVILNPHSALTSLQMEAVLLNEASRVVMTRDARWRPVFDLTPDQSVAFASYGSINDIRATIVGRLLSGDSSALTPTSEQTRFVRRLARFMSIDLSDI